MIAVISALLLWTAPVAVLVRPVERGEIVSASDIEVQDREAIEARDALSPEMADGMEAARRLPAAHLLRSGDLAPPRLVRRGEAVTLRIRHGTLSITTPGRALADGRRGQRVRVVATATNRTLDGMVDSTGRVLISAN